jgi:putative ABC transport system permease protein
VAKQIFSLSYQGDPKIWLIGLLAGGIGTGVAGLLGAGSALRQSPLATLRQL